MEAGRWSRITNIYHAAIARPPEERSSFLGEECDGDESLRKQVEAMVRSHELSGDFIELPAFAVAPELLINEPAGALVGQSIGCYQIESLLGAGGMGEVYLARDERLARKVALKLLPEHLTADETQLSRFKTEARAASALNHPNILTVYEIGGEGNRHFIATEFIEGVTLHTLLARERMSLHDVLEVAIQVASALAAAHKAGVIHRDIKPGNIMLRQDGYVKVLDFGIAKLAQADLETSQPNEQRTTIEQTIFGSIMGTLRYMSPEQVRGEPVDERTDIWSLGVVLYEMLTGAPPFDGKTAEEITNAIEQTQPAPLARASDNIPPELQQIVFKALEKNGDDRFARMNQVLERLKHVHRKLDLQAEFAHSRWLLSDPMRTAVAIALGIVAAGALFLLINRSANRNGAALTKKTIAVLPLDNRNLAESDRYFVNGIQDELVGQLSRIEALKVIAAESTQRFQSGRRNLAKIAKQLGVAYLLEGSVQRTGGQLRLEMQLSNPPARAKLWSETYERPLTDIFVVENEIRTKVTTMLRTKLSDSNRSALAAEPTESSEAHELYLRGHYLAKKGDEPDLKKAIDFYEQAIGKDPDYALAYAGLAEAYVLLPSWTNQTPTQHYYGFSRTAAEKAIALDPMLPEAHIALGFAMRQEDRDFTRAQQELERAIGLAPSSATAHYYLGYVIFAPQGDFDHAIAEMKQALELDPLSTVTSTDLGMCYFFARRYPEAIAQLRKAVELAPNSFVAHNSVGLALLLSGRVDEAIKTWKHAYDLAHHYHSLALIAFGYGVKGDRAQALQVLRQLEELEQHGTRAWALGHVLIQLSLGDKEEALQWLERGATENDSTITNNIKVLPVLDALRGDPRFERLANELVPPTKTVAASNALALVPFVGHSGDAAIARHQHLGKAITYGINLLVNGDAEGGTASTTGAPVPVPGWVTTGEFTVVPYGAPEGYPAVSEAPPNGMKRFFTGGHSELSTATQEIDVSAYASDIDAGQVICDISAWLGGYADQNDDVRFTINVKSSAAMELKSISLAPVTALERANQTGFKLRRSSISVPPQTRRIEAVLVLTRRSDTGNCNDGYADNLNIILDGPAAVTRTTHPGGGSYRGALR